MISIRGRCPAGTSVHDMANVAATSLNSVAEIIGGDQVVERRKVDAHEVAASVRIAVLLAVEDVAPALGQEPRDGMDDARAVGAVEGQQVLVEPRGVGHGDHHPAPPADRAVRSMVVSDQVGPARLRIAAVPGDGIGPEVVDATLPVLRHALALGGSDLEVDTFDWGARHHRRTGTAAPADAVDVARTYDAILLGAIGADGDPDELKRPRSASQ